jgi:ABC-type sugar transport system substrate-binding protein
MGMVKSLRAILRASLVGAVLVSTGASVLAADVKEDKARLAAFNALKGKKIVWIAATMGNDLQTEWERVFRQMSSDVGIDFSLRDANFNSAAESQALEAVINEKPDLLIVQSLNVNLLARQIKRAEEGGIPVIQLNLKSQQDSVGFVGVDYVTMGEQIAQEMVTQCTPDKQRSRKVAFVQGDISAADSYLQMQGVNAVLSKHPEIEVVSNQSGMWDPNKAHDITATVLQQHPDLCAIMGIWGVMDMGMAQAIKEANLTGKVLHYSNDGGAQYMCDAVKSGAVSKFWSYQAPGQARDVMQLAFYILQNPGKWQGLHGMLYSPMVVITPENASSGVCYQPVKK